MDTLHEQIMKIGRQMNDGAMTEDQGRAAINDVGAAHGLSGRRLRKVMQSEIEKMKADVRTKAREQIQLAMKLAETEQMKALALASQSDAPLSFLIKRFKEIFPAIWEKVALRTYKNVESFGNYQAAFLEWGWAHGLKELRLKTGEPILDALQETIDTFEAHKSHGFPFFFVSPGICEAAWQSDLKFSVDWKTMHLPFEAFTLVLPKANPLGHEAVIVYRYVKDGDIRLRLVTLGRNAIGGHIDVAYLSDEEISDTERWVFNTIFAMSARPEYVESGQRIGTRKGTQSEIWMPNIIGRKYAIKTQSVKGEASGTRRLHWRRGHFRQQAFGVGRLQHKTIWIEPMMVGGQ